MDWGLIIGCGIGALILLAVLLKLCAKFIYMQLGLELLSAIGIVVSSFAMPEASNGELNWDWVIAQCICIFAFVVFLWAGIAVEKEYYVERRARATWDDDIVVTDTLKSKGGFWGTLGGGLVAAVVLPLLNYELFGNNAIALGVVGCIATLWAVIWIIRFAKLDFGKSGPKDYY